MMLTTILRNGGTLVAWDEELHLAVFYVEEDSYHIYESDWGYNWDFIDKRDWTEFYDDDRVPNDMPETPHAIARYILEDFINEFQPSPLDHLT